MINLVLTTEQNAIKIVEINPKIDSPKNMPNSSCNPKIDWLYTYLFYVI